MYICILYTVLTLYSFFGQEKLREAAKAQIRRMVAHHKKKTMLNVPDFVREQWQQSDQNTMAKMLMECNFSKDRAHSFSQQQPEKCSMPVVPPRFDMQTVTNQCRNSLLRSWK